MDKKALHAVLQLFKVIPVQAIGRDDFSPEECLRNGFVVIKDGRPVSVCQDVYKYCRKYYGVDVKELNETFHKSFGTVQNMSDDEYYFCQFLHYLTTYGAEEFGIKCDTFVPEEDIEYPDSPLSFSEITVIKTVPEEKIIEMIDDHLRSTVSPSDLMVTIASDIMPLGTVSVGEIKSYEFQVLKYDLDGTLPDNPVSVLRYLVYKTTGSTLLIKNEEKCSLIRESDVCNTYMAYNIFKRSDLCELASIFYRFKPLFLSFKTHNGCAPIINRLRRLAVKHHKPLPFECLQNATGLGFAGDDEAFDRVIGKASNRELVKLYYALDLQDSNMNLPAVYNIRNGKTYVREDRIAALDEEKSAIAGKLKDKVFKLLAERLSGLSGKYFIIPSYLHYSIPWTEKQFVGDFPYGTLIETMQDTAFTAGIHWFNEEKQRVDIDLHLNSVDAHFGWNGQRMSEDFRIIYTGDMVDAPRPLGAAEAYVIEGRDYALLMSVYLYSGSGNNEFEFFLTNENGKDIKQKEYTFDPSKAIFAPISLKFRDGLPMNIGLFIEGAFVFYGGSLVRGRIPKGKYGDFLTGSIYQIKKMMMLEELFGKVGAHVLSEKDPIPDGVNSDDVCDLSPGKVTFRTLMDIVDGKI
ncbi:MAG: hypothetical protein K5871_02085 [Lachnospiraceae bacterium]|nr:hypothetical protein [Lachnospiraceae bacterium]